MSERPENPRDNQAGRGNWYIPADGITVPEMPPTITERKIRALPEKLGTIPDRRGSWHLPDPRNTTFSATDEISVPVRGISGATTGTPAVLRPEDLIAEIVGQRSAAQPAPLPEDLVPSRQRETETQAADAVTDDTQLVDEEAVTQADLPTFEEDDDFTMSEYVALASLAEGDEQDAEDLDPADLSPAERALFNIASQYADELPESEPPIGDDATVTLDDTSQQQAADESAADYARRMAQQYDQDQPNVGGFEYGQTPVEPQYSQQETELARQFAETRRQVEILRQMAQQGQITQADLQARLQQYTILDPQGNWWMIGYETDKWYRYDNASGQWVEEHPPVPLDAASPRTETGIGQAAPDVLPGSLPYLPADEQQEQAEYSSPYDNTQYSQAQQRFSQQYGVDDTPIPNPDQPVVDPNMTQVGPTYDATSIGMSADDTLQGVGYDDQATMQSPSASYNYAAQPPPAQAIPTGFESFDAEQRSEVYQETRQQERTGLLTVAFFGVLALMLCGMLSVIGFIGFAVVQYNQTVEPYRAAIDALGSTEIGFQTATILAADGSVIAELTGEQGARTIVSIENGEVSTWFLYALLAAREPNYYENPGTNLLSAPLAYWRSLTAGEGSEERTITQQIALSRILDGGESDELTLDEIFVAMEIANTYSKTDILNIYVNEFFFGEQTYGVEAASQFYLNKPAAELNAADAALLVGILDSPSNTNPVASQAIAFSDMRDVLDAMIEAPCITFEHTLPEQNSPTFCVDENTRVPDGNGGEALLFRRNSDGSFGGLLSLQIAEVETRNYEARQTDIRYPHFVRYVLGELDQAYGEGAYIERGFTVQTTLIPTMADAAQRALEQGIEGLQFNNGVQTGAVVMIDPQNGAIRAMVGSPDFNDASIQGSDNRTISYEEPGDVIKPLVYTAALSGGPNGYYTPASIIWDVPTVYPLADGSVYNPPGNAGGYRGAVPLRYAMQQTLHVPAVRAYGFVGRATFANTADVLGIDFDPDPDDGVGVDIGLDTALGKTPVTLMDLTHAYATLAADGVYHEVFAIDGITENRDGDEFDVELREPLVRGQAQQVISPQVAFLMQNILSDNQARSAAIYTRPSTYPQNSALAGQFVLDTPNANQNTVAAVSGANNIGETANPSRLWTVGFTNNIAVGVWVGTVNEQDTLVGGVDRQTGAAPIWNAIMRAAVEGRPPGPFQNPAGVVQEAVCFLTGEKAPPGSTCPTRVQEIYWQQNPPPEPGQGGFTQTVSIDSWTNRVANQWCPENVVERTYANVDQQIVNWLNDTSLGRDLLTRLGIQPPLETAPTESCQQNQVLPQINIAFPQPGTTVTEPQLLPITGQVSAPNLERWQLLISEAGQNNFRPITSARNDTVGVAGTVLTEWDPQSVPNNQAYTLRLEATSTQGGFIRRDVNIQITLPNPTPTPIPSPTPPTFEPIASPLPFDDVTIPTSTPDN